MIRIRDAGPDDLDTLIALGSKMWAESTEPAPPIEREWVRERLDMAVSHPETFLVVLAEDDGPVGMITAVAGPHGHSSRSRTASEFLFVLPQYRGSVAARRVIRRFSDWSDGLGAENATLSIASGVSPERTGRFFELLGFRPMGMTYQKDF